MPFSKSLQKIKAALEKTFRKTSKKAVVGGKEIQYLTVFSFLHFLLCGLLNCQTTEGQAFTSLARHRKSSASAYYSKKADNQYSFIIIIVVLKKFNKGTLNIAFFQSTK